MPMTAEMAVEFALKILSTNDNNLSAKISEIFKKDTEQPLKVAYILTFMYLNPLKFNGIKIPKILVIRKYW